jgi:3-methyladenine DNA glycosylase AlkD
VGELTREALAWLERHGTKKTRDGMAGYGITAKKAFGVTMGDIRVLAKRLGTNHDLAVALWNTGVYEARMLTAFVADPQKLTAAQMDQWCRDFDSWAICDTLCFALFDRSPDAFDKVKAWAKSNDEFIKRAAFALLACLALHDRGVGDEPFLKLLPLIERACMDGRNFVKKAVNWALRAIGGRSKPLHAESLDMARRLADSSDATARWIGKDAEKALEGSATMKRLARKKK